MTKKFYTRAEAVAILQEAIERRREAEDRSLPAPRSHYADPWPPEGRHEPRRYDDFDYEPPWFAREDREPYGYGGPRGRDRMDLYEDWLDRYGRPPVPEPRYLGESDYDSIIDEARYGRRRGYDDGYGRGYGGRSRYRDSFYY